MSTLKAQLNAAMKDAMRAKEKERLSTIRLIQADIKRVEVDTRSELDDAQLIAIMDRMLKQRRDSIAQFEAAGRQELADQEAFEISVIQQFLPTPLSDDEINTLIDQAIAATGASGMQDMGKLMAMLKPQIQGRADMAAVSGAVKKRLG
ncbi:MAG TPA: GatB/YqeY domain-containing protein [Pseudomonadales bacterium]